MPAAPAGLNAARRAAELAARTAYGRLVAWLAAHGRDLAAAEDALADAFAAALARWPETGVPDRPEAWLLTSARNRLADGARHAAVRRAGAGAVTMLLEAPAEEDGGIPDRRLRLLLACAHPAVPQDSQAPLMMQVVLGLTAARIGSAWLVAPAAMAQRLVRAKTALHGLPFALPEAGALAGRLPAVLAAIYAAATLGWDDGVASDLSEEALYLARLVTSLAPREPEALGLLALLLHLAARRAARRDADGAFVPLAGQDRGSWEGMIVAEAERQLRHAAGLGRPGRFQLEAAIQSAHATGAPAQAVLMLYDRLLAVAPSLGGAVARGAVLAEVAGPATALAALDALEPARVADFQPYWAVRADLLRRAGQDCGAAYDRAAGLTADPALRRFLLARRSATPGRH